MEDKHTIFGARFPMGDSAVTLILIFGVHLGQLPMEDLHSTLYYCNCQHRNNNTVPHGRWAADCHQHSLSSLVQYPMEDEQRTVISTVCHLQYIASYRWPQDKIYLHISLNDLCDFRSAQMMCNHVLQQLPWTTPTSSARLLLARGSSVWPNSALDFYHTQSELVRRANSWTGPYMPK